MKAKGLLFGAVLGLAAVGPAQAFVFNTPNPHVFEAPFGSLFDTRLLNLDAKDSIAFNRVLNEGYIKLSDARGEAWKHGGWDFPDAELFKHKARTAARNSLVLPENPLDWELSEGQYADFVIARDRLIDGFERGGRFEAPYDAANAQVSYDCWIEAESESRVEGAETCKAAFLEAMAEVDRWADHSLSAFNVIVRAAPGVVADQAYLVYFDFDRADLLPEGSQAIDDILAAAAAEPDLTVRIVAHTDTVGGLDYNQALSERRANAVILSLIQGGLNRSRIISEPVGETRLMVDTDDGVNEPDNRVAEIDLL